MAVETRDDGSPLLDVIGFGSLNLDEFWEVPPPFSGSKASSPGANTWAIWTGSGGSILS